MKRVVGLLALNESVTLYGEWIYGTMIVTAVGALNVGGIYLKHPTTLSRDNTSKSITVSFQHYFGVTENRD